MSKLVSLRLEDELAAWVEDYREVRGWSRAELISTALRSFREDAERGVPDVAEEPVVPVLPTPDPETVVRIQKTVEERERELRERHRKFAREMGWA